MRGPFSPVTEIHNARLEVWYAPIFLLERYSLTFFSLVWFGATILNYYIKILIIATTVICEIGINRKVNAYRFDSRFFNLGSLAAFLGIAAALIWKYEFDRDLFLFKYDFVRLLYLHTKEHEILYSSSTAATQACLQEYELFFVEKILLYMSFGFSGILFLRWIKLYVYRSIEKNILRLNNIRLESFARLGVYGTTPALLLWIYFVLIINLQYCVYNVRKMPIVLLFFLIVFGIAYDCLNVFRWRLLINQETNPKEEVKDV
jgi:hypothetical protein